VDGRIKSGHDAEVHSLHFKRAILIITLLITLLTQNPYSPILVQVRKCHESKSRRYKSAKGGVGLTLSGFWRMQAPSGAFFIAKIEKIDIKVKSILRKSMSLGVTRGWVPVLRSQDATIRSGQ
jgi:hypothetical protein